jgi:hypothetical protein
VPYKPVNVGRDRCSPALQRYGRCPGVNRAPFPG